MKKPIFLLFVLSLLFSCDEDDIDCSAVDCVGFPSLNFELLLDGQNALGENLLTLEEISLSGDHPEPTELDSFNVSTSATTETQILVLSSFAWEEKTYDFNLNIGSEYTSNIVAEVERTSSGGCCGGIPFIKSLEIDGQPIQNPNTLISLNITL